MTRAGAFPVNWVTPSARNADDSREEPYKAILAAYPNAWMVDQAGGGMLDNGQLFHYVGEQTMAREVQLAAEMARVKQGLDVVVTNVMIADADLNVVYVNNSIKEMLTRVGNYGTDIRVYVVHLN